MRRAVVAIMNVMGLMACAGGGAAVDAPLLQDESIRPEVNQPIAARGLDPSYRAFTPRPAHTIYRSEIHRAVGTGPAYLLRQLDPEPFRLEGRFMGWTIATVFPDDPELCAPGCDLAPGDVVLALQGRVIHTPDDLIAVLEALGSATTLTIDRYRANRRERVSFAIVDDVDNAHRSRAK